MDGRKIVVIFDGTGPVDNSKYNDMFENSFCHRIYKSIKESHYSRGVPGEEGRIWETIRPMFDEAISAKVSHGLSKITRGVSKGGAGAKIFLIGHSRGGLCCVILAQKLHEMKIPVEAMFLFDAVNMTFKSSCDVPNKYAILMPPVMQLEAAKYIICRAVEGVGGGYGGTIPDNVRYVYHAMRDPAFANQFHAEVAQKAAALRGIYPASEKTAATQELADKLRADLQKSVDRLNRTRSNASNPTYNWGNCATKVASSGTKFIMKKFMGSHGAVGGCPWPKDVFENDDTCAAQVEKWMWPFIRTHQLFGPNVAVLLKGAPRMDSNQSWTMRV